MNDEIKIERILPSEPLGSLEVLKDEYNHKIYLMENGLMDIKILTRDEFKKLYPEIVLE